MNSISNKTTVFFIMSKTDIYMANVFGIQELIKKNSKNYNFEKNFNICFII